MLHESPSNLRRKNGALLSFPNQILKKYDLFCVHYAHAGSGELHLRPIINLKTEEGNNLFRIILEEIARLAHGVGEARGAQPAAGGDRGQLQTGLQLGLDHGQGALDDGIGPGAGGESAGLRRTR